MRKLRRPAVSLPTLTGNGKGALQAAKNVQWRAADPTADLSFPDHWKESDVRGALYAMHGGLCAYCQCELQNDPGDVEHFRPKALYWWLAYDFANYLLSCRKCNSICKGQKFPLSPGVAPWDWADRDRLQEEKILLLDPVTEDVEAWIRVIRRKRVGKVMFFVIPAPTNEALSELRLRIETTIQFFRLNDPQLVKQRSDVIYCALQALKPALAGDRSRVKKVRKMASRFQPHGAAIRQILAKRAPELIPSPKEDLRGLVQDLILYWGLAEDRLTIKPEDELVRRYRRELLWALAVLWKDPPAGSPDLVKRWLMKAGRWDEVESLIREWTTSSS